MGSGFWLLWNKWNFRLFYLFHFGLVLDRLLVLDVGRIAPLCQCSSRTSKSSIEVVEFCEFRKAQQVLPEPVRWPRPPLLKAKSQKSQTSKFAFLISFFVDR